jgi:hypothetical protein
VSESEYAVWYEVWGSPDFDLEDSETEAANLAVTIEESDRAGVIEGVQLKDGRLIPAAEWLALSEARDRRKARWRERQNQPPRPTRTTKDPFSGKSLNVDLEDPDWVGGS